MRRTTGRILITCLGLLLTLNLNLDLVFASTSLIDRVIEHRLANGLTLLMVERRHAPVVSINVTFGVGGVNELTGQTGVAHLYEHMAFKGTRRLGTTNYERERPLLDELDRLNAELEQARKEIAALRDRGQPEDQALQGKAADLEARFAQLQEQAGAYVVENEIPLLYQRHGGVGMNASTGKDVTRYVVSLPSNRLPLWAAIEADRMAHPVMREFYKERAVVMEERRLRTDDSPAGLLYEAFSATAFHAHPYHAPTIGWGSDIQALTPAVTEDFFRRYYAPNNAVIAIVGDINPPEVIGLVERTFGKIPRGPMPPPVVTVEPAQRGERRVEVEFDAEPVVLIGYHKPAIGHPDDYVFDVIEAVLSDGVTSRLYERLVREKKLAVSVDSDTTFPGAQFPNLFAISAAPRAPHTTAEVEAAIYAELERLKTEPVSKSELEKVLNNLDAYLLRSLRSSSGLAGSLAYYQTITSDWRYLVKGRDRIASVTPEDIQRVAKTYFTKNNRTVATLVKVPVANTVARTKPVKQTEVRP
ncbi:MAG TPA: pitrilysin family protein [Nitrospiraceae bacterium]|nr:pitrilysin family protein [Nitrospiraceae bacterium]